MQEFLALCCFQCGQFQVVARKKVAKWSCVICSAKQSVKKVYGRAEKAKEMRELVQRLNMARGEMGAASRPHQDEWSADIGDGDFYGDGEEYYDDADEYAEKPPIPQDSEWGAFVEESKEHEAHTEGPDNDDGVEYVFAVPEKKAGRRERAKRPAAEPRKKAKGLDLPARHPPPTSDSDRSAARLGLVPWTEVDLEEPEEEFASGSGLPAPPAADGPVFTTSLAEDAQSPLTAPQHPRADVSRPPSKKWGQFL